MTTAYFLLHSRNVPTRTSSGAKVHWTPIVGTAAIKEATGVVAEDLRKHPLVKTGMIEEISEETYEGLKKKVVKLSTPWSRHGPQSRSEPKTLLPQPASAAAAPSDPAPKSEPTRKRSKPVTAKGALAPE